MENQEKNELLCSEFEHCCNNTKKHHLAFCDTEFIWMCVIKPVMIIPKQSMKKKKSYVSLPIITIPAVYWMDAKGRGVQ